VRVSYRHLCLTWLLIGSLLIGCQPSVVDSTFRQPRPSDTLVEAAAASATPVPAASATAQSTETRASPAPPATSVVAPSATPPTVTPQEPTWEWTSTPRATNTPRPALSATAVQTIAATSLAAEPMADVTVPSKPVTVTWGEITINTSDYESALYFDPQKAGHPYPLLHEDHVGPPRPRAYRVLRLRNEYLELTLLPELGGRIYQCRFLPTGQEIFYNNPVIKPTHWGPVDQGWWLAAGGMEFCLPVDEHGYVTAQPWETTVSSHQDGSVTAAVQLVEQSRNVHARVEITLRPGESAFHIRPVITNPDETAKQLQFWINAMLAPGSPSVQPSTTFHYPASEVIVHSRGADRSLPDAHQAMTWPVYDGRDWSRYSTWHDWLGFFAPHLEAPFTAVYDRATEIGMMRIFPPSKAQGVKLFGFGLDFGDSRTYTDNGSQYVEMWGGWTPTFWDYGTLSPRGTVEWQETWYVLAKSGGPSMATARASLNVEHQGRSMRFTVASPAKSRWTLVVARKNERLYRQAIEVRPDAPFAGELLLAEDVPSEDLLIELFDETGQAELSFRPGSR
jgi:hypothetical protein